MSTTNPMADTGDSTMSGPASSPRSGSFSDRFFRISKVVASAQMLSSWVDWFKQLNIPCAVTKGNGGYSLWRSGEEIGDETSTSIGLQALRKMRIVYSFGLTAGDEAEAPIS